MRRRLFPSFAVALTLPFLIAACGDDEDKNAGQAGSTPAATSTAPSKKAGIALTEAVGRAPRAVRPDAVAPEAPGSNSVSYCSPSGDYCTGIRAAGGDALLSIATFAFRGRYRLCITGPPGRGCKSFLLRRQRRGLFASTVRFSPPQSGRYSASWFTGGTKLGRTLSFRVS